jgi:hypothetical protein
MRGMISIERVLVVVGLLVITSTAFAGIPPQSEEELNELSDIVVDAEVVEIQVTGVTEVPDEMHRVHFEATLEVLNAHLGDAPDSFVITFNHDFIDQGVASCGFSEPAHWVGEKAKLWLQLNDDENYGMVSWNAMEELADSQPNELSGDEILALANGDEPKDPPVIIEDPNPQPTSTNGGQGAGCSMTASGTPVGFVPFLLFGLIALAFRLRRRAC